MDKSKLPTELYEAKTFFTLGGLSFAVYILSSISGDVFNFNPKWFALLAAIFLSYACAFYLNRKNKYELLVAFFNGLLIYITAVGFNNLANSNSDKFKIDNVNKKIEIGYNKISQNQEKVYLSCFNIPFKNQVWFMPSEAIFRIDSLRKENNIKNNIIRVLSSDSINYSVSISSYLDSLHRLEVINCSLEKQIEKLASNESKIKNQNKLLSEITDSLINQIILYNNQSQDTLLDIYEYKFAHLSMDIEKLKNMLSLVLEKQNCTADSINSLKEHVDTLGYVLFDKEAIDFEDYLLNTYNIRKKNALQRMLYQNKLKREIKKFKNENDTISNNTNLPPIMKQ